MDVKRRHPEFPALPLLVNRCSSRAMSGEAVSELELMTIFEAGKWAQSSYNDQPWRFVYVTKDDAQWGDFFNLLVPVNQEWAKGAWVLVVIVSHKNFTRTGEFSPTHSYDTGAAGQNMALQGFSMNLIVHGIGGFDYARARDLVKVPENYAVEAMLAIGRPGPITVLPEKWQAREALTERRPLVQTIFRGGFGGALVKP